MIFKGKISKSNPIGHFAFVIKTYMTNLLVFSAFMVVLTSNKVTAQVHGCTDPLAVNYDLAATYNDGSCIYDAASVLPTASFDLAGYVVETSGLLLWSNYIWTHNDSDDINLYALDSANGNFIRSYPLSGTTNIDWEEISQDDAFIYIGDFGNNQTGNRTDLRILKIDKNSILGGTPEIETIHFTYSNQADYTPSGSNNTDFDCEAFIVSTDSIFLFTKQWISLKTSVYALPKAPGTYVAKLKSTFDVKGLITGATYPESKKLIALSGYSKDLQPFVYLLYDFPGSDFFNGNKRKIAVSLPFHQVEGIATSNGLKYYISNEKFVQAPFINTPQKLHTIDLSNFLTGYLTSLVSLPESYKIENGLLFPNPASDLIWIKTDKARLPADFLIINPSGNSVMKGKLTEEHQCIDFSAFAPGLYILKTSGINPHSYKVIKR